MKLTNGIASPKHVEETAANLTSSGVQRLDRSPPVCRGAGGVSLYSEAGPFLTAAFRGPHTSQNERTRIVEQAFRSTRSRLSFG